MDLNLCNLQDSSLPMVDSYLDINTSHYNYRLYISTPYGTICYPIYANSCSDDKNLRKLN